MKMSCGLFGLATEMEQDFWGLMKNLKTIGFHAVEPLVALPGDPALDMLDQLPPFLKALLWTSERIADMQPELKKIGLVISSGHIGFGLGVNPSDMDEAILQTAEKTGIKHFLTSMTFDSKEKAEYCAIQLSMANEKLNPYGVTLGYHNHEMEFQVMDRENSDTLMDYFLACSDKNVKLELDTGWQMYGGNDVLAFMQQHRDRIQAVHLKDFVKDYQKLPRDDSFAAIGDGELPTKEIVAFASELELFDCGFMIDQDKAAKNAVLLEDLQKGMEYLRSLYVSR